MKLVVAAVALLVSTLLLSAQSNTGVIEGRVVSSTTSEPISGATVSIVVPTSVPAGLSPEQLQQRAAQLESARLSVLIAGGGAVGAEEVQIDGKLPGDTYMLSDADGRFTFRNLAPGRYMVRASRAGYTGPPRNGGYSSGIEKSVEVRAGSSSTDLVLLPGVIMAGRVFDPLGQPAINAVVREYRVLYRDGQEYWGAGRDITTDDHGAYRLPITSPGQSYLGVIPPAGAAAQSWEQTYYPSATEPENATLIPVPPGSVNTTLDIHLQPRRTDLSKIRGVAVNPFATANRTTGVVDRSVSSFFLIPPTPSVFSGLPTVSNAIPVASRQNGEFELANVRPGQYELVAYIQDPATRKPFMARTPVDVRGPEIGGISLTLDPGVTLTGQVEFRGTSSTAPGTALSVVLQSLAGLPFGVTQRIENGMFVAERVPRIRYRVNVTGLPQGAYVADVRLEGTSIFDKGFVPGEGSGPIQIVVETAGETVTGAVKGPKGETFEAGTVVLVPPMEQRQNPQRYPNGIVDDQGHFTIRGVPAGSYTAYAWESVRASAWLNVKFMSQYQGEGHLVNVVAGSKNELALQGIPGR